MKKKICLLLVAIVILTGMCGCGKGGGIPETPAEDFSYEMEDGEVIITGYKGSDLEIRIPEQINNRPVTVIGEEAFAGYDLTKIVIPKTVKIIDTFAFDECTCLTSVILNEGLETIGSFVFTACSSLEKISIPDTVTTIGEQSFRDCSKLTEVTLPDKLTTIEAHMFQNCESLKKITLPKELTTLEGSVFSGCYSLKSIDIPEDTTITWDMRIDKVYDGETQGTYISIFAPTIFIQEFLNKTYAKNSEALQRIIEIEPSVPVMNITKDSTAHNQLKELESAHDVNLQELGLYKIK